MRTLINRILGEAVRLRRGLIYVVGPIAVLLLVAIAAILHGHSDTEGRTLWQQFIKGFTPELLAEHLVHFSSAIVIAIIAYAILKRLDRSREEAERLEHLEDIEDLFLKYSKELRSMTIAEALPQCIRYLRAAKKRILAIGHAKSEVLEREPQGEIADLIRAYMAGIEEAAAQRRVEHKRITTSNMNAHLVDHLRKCLAGGINGKGTAEVLVMDDNAAANTYIIVDDKFIFISPTAQERAGNMEVSQHCYVSTDKRVIKIYAEHFQQYYNRWKDECPVCKNPDDLTQAKVENMKRLTEGVSTIRSRALRLVGEPLWKTNYAEQVMSEAERLLEQMVTDKFTIQHHKSYADLEHSLSFFLKSIKADDEYQAVSFVPFWKKVLSKQSAPEFLEANQRALNAGAQIWRLLVLDWERIVHPNKELKGKVMSGVEYRQVAMQTIARNLEWTKRENYTFYVLFADTKELEADEGFDFVRVRMGDEHIIIRPDTALNPASTEVSCVSGPDKLLGHLRKPDAFGMLDEKLKDYHLRLAKQWVNDEQMRFLTECFSMTREEWMRYLRAEVRMKVA